MEILLVEICAKKLLELDINLENILLADYLLH